MIGKTTRNGNTGNATPVFEKTVKVFS